MRIVGAEFEIMGNCQGGRAVRLQDQGECDSWCDYGPSRGTGLVGGQNRCRPAGEQWCLHWNVELESGDSHWSKLKPQSPIISDTDASPATRLRVAWVERFPCIWQRTWGWSTTRIWRFHNGRHKEWVVALHPQVRVSVFGRMRRLLDANRFRTMARFKQNSLVAVGSRTYQEAHWCSTNRA